MRLAGTALGAELDKGTLIRTAGLTEGWDTGGVLVCFGCYNKHHRPGRLHHRNSQKSMTKVSAGLLSPETSLFALQVVVLLFVKSVS